MFDYGVLRLETASSKTTIIFTEAPDPEGIKRFVSDAIKHCRPDIQRIVPGGDPLFNGIGVRR